MSQPSTPPRTALVLAGGGARGAYQVGVLRGFAELGVLDRSASGLDTFCGSSAGAINSSVLAAHACAPVAGIDQLERLWSGVSASDIFRTDVRSLGQIGVQWAWDLTFGGIIGGGTQRALLDTTPLRGFLQKHVPFRQLDEQIECGSLYALAISATDLASGDGVLFLHGRPDIEEWQRRRWHLRRTAIGAEHVMASSAIPILFPSVEVAGRHYGDGSVRNTAPLSPAINLGAERIVAVSVRERTRPAALAGPSPTPTIAQVAAVLLDAVLLDAVEVDVDHSARVNRSVVALEDTASGRGRLRSIDVLWMQPSVDIARLAAEHAHSIPGVVRYLMRGLGSTETITDLASFLLFDATFCRTLIEAGRADALASRDEVLAFFAGRPPG